MTLPAHLARLGVAGAMVAAGLGVLGAAPARAATPSCPVLHGTSPASSAGTVTSPAGGNPFVVCTYRLRTFDGTPLHVDVSIPTVAYTPPGSQTAAAPPLVMFLSGWSNDVCQFESTTLEGSAVSGCTDFIGNAGYHWNNAWFASQGFVTLNYTPRGWYDSCGKDASTGYTYVSDMQCRDTTGEQSWVHLYDRRYEIRDAQYLAGVLVDAGLVNPNQIITTGDSGGGGPSWDLALSQDQVVQTDSTPTSIDAIPWTSPSGTALHLVAALPLYTWTDLIDALMPNGTSSDGFHGAPADGDHASPVGVEKQSYVLGLFAEGLSNVPSAADRSAQYSVPGIDPTADLTTWFAEINGGEPYAAPNLATIVAQIGGPLRSPFAIPVPTQHEIPIFASQGFTDPLFAANQALTMINRLKTADPNYPVWGFFGDLGHSYADNPLDVWQQDHNEGNAWLTSVLAGTLPADPTVTADTTRCVAGQTLQSYSGDSFGALATAGLTFSGGAAQTTASSKLVTPEDTATDPIANSGCRTMAASQSDPDQASYTFAVPSAATLIGGPVVNVDAAVTGSSAELAARLWDVDPSGNQTLVSRSVYRLEEGTASPTTSTHLDFELWPNAWQLQCGHSIKLELTQDDGLVWRPDNEPSSMSLTNLRLSLPVVPGAACVPETSAAEAPLLPVLPAIALSACAGAALIRRRRRPTR